MLKKLVVYVICFIAFSTAVKAETLIPIVGGNTEGKQLLTNNVIELMGPQDAAEFYYEIENELVEGDYYVQFYLEHSSLLVEPSAATLYIDGQPVQSFSLAETLKEIKYMLPQDALTEGIHSIKFEFFGYILQGVCPPQDGNANWLTIQINSYLNLPVTNTTTAYLNHYPEKFQRDTQIIVPTSPSLKTLEAALEIAQYLPDAEVVEEKEVSELSSNFIVVGVRADFESSWLTSLLKPSEEGLQLATTIVENKTNYARMLQVVASDEQSLSYYKMLTTAHLVQQLAGQNMVLTNLPNTEKVLLDETITLDELGMTSFILDTNETATNTYFYYLPMSKLQLQNPSVTVNFKRSHFISPVEDATGITNNTELIIYLNEVPHAIDLKSYPADELVSVTLPFDTNIIKDSQLLSVRFAGNGLVQKNPCLTTDVTKWIYIDDTTHVTLPVKNEEIKQAFMFRQFPFPFMEPNEMLTIVKAPDVTLKELQGLYKSLASQMKLATTQLVEEVTSEQLENGHVIFIGGADQHASLQDATNLIVEFKDGRANLVDEGFVETDLTTYAFVQNNPWNEKYGMLVFGRLSANTPYIKEQTFEFLRNNDSSGTVLVDQYEIVTNENLIEKDGVSESDTKTKEIYLWIATLVIFVIVAFTIMWYFKRRKKSLE